MHRFWILLLWAVSLSAQAVPDLYIVELAGEPAVTVAKDSRRQAASARRLEIRGEQQQMRRAIEATRARVLAGVETVANALVVEAPGSAASGIAGLAGVKRVYPVDEVRLELDHALPLHRVPDAWREIGGLERAGAGVKIAVVDTGIDHNHPGFRNFSLSPPEGFPKANRESDLAFTNSKVIVARSYEDLLNLGGDATAQDVSGHGTAVAMVAAGLPSISPSGEITGVAPGAYLGSYKVFSGVSGGTTRTDVILKAVDDAVADGMDVINLSLGVVPARRVADDILVQALERASAAGVIVATSAGNEGPDPNTLSSPSTALSVIAVGASWNDRILGATVALGGAEPLLAIPSDGPGANRPIQAVLVDVTPLDGSGLACGSLPAGSLAGTVALILRGECRFEEKLNNAQQAGALAAVVYTDEARPDPVIMAVGAATLPGMMVSFADGIALKAQLAVDPLAQAVLQFQGAAFPVDPNRVASFSSRGPGESNTIKPDILAVGVEVSTAAQRSVRAGDLFDASGYTVADGTSFSSPMIAGAAAVLKSARPALEVRHYRSLLINSSTPLPPDRAGVQQTGGGTLDLAAAVRSTVSVSPTSVSFGYGSGTTDRSRQITVTNLGTAADTFSISVAPFNDGSMPRVSPNVVELGPGASYAVVLNWTTTALEPGAYQGFLRIQGTRTEALTRVPYWYAVAGNVPANLTLLNAPETGSAGGTVTILFRVTDSSGVDLFEVDPQVVVVSGEGSVTGVRLIDDQYPGVYSARVRLGPASGVNVFRLEAGPLSREVSVRAPFGGH